MTFQSGSGVMGVAKKGKKSKKDKGADKGGDAAKTEMKSAPEPTK